MATFAFNFAIDKTDSANSIALSSNEIDPSENATDPSENGMLSCEKAIDPSENAIDSTDFPTAIDRAKSAEPECMSQAAGDDTEEPKAKKVKLAEKENHPKESRLRPYEELAWDGMIEECLRDAEIETVRCSTKDAKDEKIQLFTLHPSLVETRLLSLNDDRSSAADDDVAEAAERRSDLVPRVYEGGLKIWECSLDLVVFLRDNIDRLFPPGDGRRKRRLKVLELGCGAGLPGIWALSHPGVDQVHFQDYNRRVVLGFTMPNIVVNNRPVEEDDDDDDDDDGDAKKLKTLRCRFHCGDWSAMVEKVDEKFDLILASETIYSLDDLPKFRDAVVHFLRPEGGVALVAAKEYYFGVGGGVDAFMDAVANGEKPMKSRANWIEQHGVRRAVIELRISSVFVGV